MDLAISDLEHADFPVIRDWIDPELFHIFKRPITDDQLERLLTGENDLGLKAVDQETGSAVGLMHAVLNRENSYAHIGQILAKPGLERQGIGTALMERTLEVLFAEHGFHRVQLFVDEENVAAFTFYRKHGFQVDGLMRESRRVGDKYLGWHCMSILDREWLNQR